MESTPVYFARLTFYKDSHTVKVEVRPTKKGHKLKKFMNIPEDIDYQELHWERIRNRYAKGTFAIYERKENSKGSIYYIDSLRVIPHASLNQKLENLLRNSLEGYK